MCGGLALTTPLSYQVVKDAEHGVAQLVGAGGHQGSAIVRAQQNVVLNVVVVGVGVVVVGAT